MIPFLKSIARAYVSRYPDLSDFCFVFPNKRSSTFFTKHLHDEVGGKPRLAPRMMSIADLAEFISGKVVDNRVDQLFMLYKAYCRLSGRGMSEEGSPRHLDFESFRGWGETVLSDFNEVDMYLVDPDEIFKNVRDFREITSNHLTEEQKRVMNEYFGYPEDTRPDLERFWKNFGGEGGEESAGGKSGGERGKALTTAKRKFLLLWQTLAPLYHELHKALSESGLSTSGGVLRLAVSRLEEIRETDGWKDEIPWRKLVFVGFNALATAEEKLFSAFANAPEAIVRTSEGESAESFADFLWDGAGPFFPEGDRTSPGSRFLLSNRRRFPEPDWFPPFRRLSDPERLPDTIRVIAAPSNTAQAKIASGVVGEIRKELPSGDFRDAKVAVVLPDESLLIPLLHSLPEDVDVNLTMGYPLRLTSTMSFIAHIRTLQTRSRSFRGERCFYHGYLRRVLAHPFAHLLFGSGEIARITRWLDSTHRFLISGTELKGVSPEVSRYLYPIEPGVPAGEVSEYIRVLLSAVSDSINERGEGDVCGQLDKDHIALYLDALARLTDALAYHEIPVRGETLFLLADRLLAGETVTFQGEPLRGLQVMGLLETRALDFDHIVIPSLNERIFPAKARTRTFIPNSIRTGFGMPPSNHAENLSAYYFYRMISRARGVTLIYDGRSGAGLRTGDVSRYILQLQHIYAPGRVRFENHSFGLNPSEPADPSVRKSEEIKGMLQEYLVSGSNDLNHGPCGGGRMLSATSLWNYSVCPVNFYYQNLIGLRTDDAPSEYIDPILQGNIIHSVLQTIYDSGQKSRNGEFFRNPRLIDEAYLRDVIERKDYLERLVGKAINMHLFRRDGEEADVERTPLHGAAEMMAVPMARMVRRFLEYDLQDVPFHILGCEMEACLPYSLPDGRQVNMKFIIDRIDMVDTPAGKRIRVIDYKTGSSKVEADETGDMFDGRQSCHHLFQLMLYSVLLEDWMERNGMEKVPISPLLYSVPNVFGKQWKPVPVVGGEEILSHNQIKEEYKERLSAMVAGLFDCDRPFTPAPRPENCRYCPLNNLCGR